MRMLQRCLPAILLLIVNVYSYAQPAPYSTSSNINFVRVWEATAPDRNESSLITRPVKEVLQSTSYFDGLGRLLQKVVKKGAFDSDSSAVDLVVPFLYDGYNRQPLKYLPFASRNTAGAIVNDGNFKLNPFQQQVDFADRQYPGENFLYEQTILENSPLGRVEKLFPPGNSWVGNSKGTESKYWFNTATDDVKIISVNENPGGFASYSLTGTYAAGTLYKTVTINENDVQVIEFKDKTDQLVLRKEQIGATADNGSGQGYDNWLCTYYIHDNNGSLRCIIQPEGVKWLKNNSWQLSDAIILAEQCFRFEYDERNRLVIKKIPGAGEVQMVYDCRDRLVFHQDGNQRANNKWLVILYDALNRPVITGSVNYNGTRTQLQSVVTTQTTSAGNNPVTIEGVAINRNPMPSGVVLEMLTVTYYDSYNWAASLNNSLKNFDISSINNYLLPANEGHYPEIPVKSNLVSGLATGSKIRIPGTSPAQYITVVKFYDEKKRLVQERTLNSTGGYDVLTTQYSWSGNPLVVVSQQQKSGQNPQSHTIVTRSEYDDLWRLTGVYKTVNSVIGGNTISKPTQEISKRKYDALGQLKQKSVGNNLEQIDYDYNIRGWLLGANKKFVTGDQTRFFGFELGYDKISAIVDGTSYQNPQLNGNISGTIWKSAGDNEKRKFDYSYDAANRLTSADFNQYTGSGFSKAGGLNFSMENLSYDANGNIKTMKQYGWKINQSNAVIDDLQYNYYDKSNKLKNVIDAANDVNTTMGDFRSSQLYMDQLTQNKTQAATDYYYDANGNLIRDLNKDIGTATLNGIFYNLFNQPDSIRFEKAGGLKKGTIRYTYDGAGTRLRKIVEETGKPAQTTLYLGNAVYQNDTLQFLMHEEGRLRYDRHYFSNNSNAWEYNYDYFLKDHLGNVRMVVTEQKDTARYIATMEPGYRTVEDSLFSNVGTTASTTPVFYPSNDIDVTNPNAFVSKLAGTSGNKLGPSIVLKVMGGDKISLFAKSFYQTNTGTPSDIPVQEIVAGLANSLLGIAGPGKGSLAQLTDISSPLTSGISLFKTTSNPSIPGKPKAYLNWILFDEQLKSVNDGVTNGADPVGTAGQLKPHNKLISIPKNGYLYIYITNETPGWDVYFNDMIVEHRAGNILEETHYYPFGLTIAGISSKAAKKMGNKLRFNSGSELNNGEFSDGSGLELYETSYRKLDPQLGRFWQIDPLAELTREISPYAYANNNPVLLNDPMGLFADSSKPGFSPDNPKVLDEVVVVHRYPEKRLTGGEFNGKLFSQIGSNLITNVGISMYTTKKYIRHDQIVKAVEDMMKSLKEVAKYLNIGADALGGGIGAKEFIEFLKNGLKEGKIKIGNPAVLLLATVMVLKADQLEEYADQIQTLLFKHSNATRNDKTISTGIFVIEQVYSVSAGGSFSTSTVTSFYESFTGKHIGSLSRVY